MTKKEPAGSLVHFQRAADAFPNFYEAYYAMGLAQMILSRAEDAEQAFQKSIDVSGGHYAAPHFGLSVLLCNQRKFAEAEPIIRKALELEPGFGPGYFTLSWALFGLNRLGEAEKNARETALREPKLGLARLLLANIYIHRRDYLAASGELRAYLKLEPNGTLSPQARQTLEAIQRSLAIAARSQSFVAAAPTKP